MSTPPKLQAGDLLEWTYGLTDYPAPVWTLTQSFYKSDGTPSIPDQTGVDDNGDHVITITPTVSATLPEGVHNYSVTVTTDGSDRVTVDSGQVLVIANAAAIPTGEDRRSHAIKMLEAIESFMAGNATHEQISFAFEDISISNMSPEQVIARWSFWKARVNLEAQASNAKAGRPNRSVLNAKMWSR